MLPAVLSKINYCYLSDGVEKGKKTKVTPVHTVKACVVYRGISPVIFNLGTKWGDQHHVPIALSPGKNPGTNVIGGMVDLQSPCRGSNPGLSSP
jgi:hypothetical protein